MLLLLQSVLDSASEGGEAWRSLVSTAVECLDEKLYKELREFNLCVSVAAVPCVCVRVCLYI
jgi:hypothetical protein